MLEEKFRHKYLVLLTLKIGSIAMKEYYVSVSVAPRICNDMVLGTMRAAHRGGQSGSYTAGVTALNGLHAIQDAAHFRASLRS